MNKILAYLKYRSLLLLYYFLTLLFLLLTAFLSGANMKTALYLALLLSFVLVCLLLFDGMLFSRRRKTLSAFFHAMPELNGLPEAHNAIEADLSALLKDACASCRMLQSRLDTLQREQLDYYSLWVHQIKTPIAAMRLAIEGSGDAASPVLLQELFKIEQYADLALRYAKLGDIASDLIIEPCELGSAICESVKKFSLLFVYQKLSITLPDIKKTMITDRRWLCFILEQIISNSLKYTKSGGITISLEGNELTLSDTGIGIKPEDLPRIFEKGYTGYNGRIDSRASGIGLYLCKKAADALCIGITVRSKLHHGTSVTLKLPENSVPLE